MHDGIRTTFYAVNGKIYKKAFLVRNMNNFSDPAKIRGSADEEYNIFSRNVASGHPPP